MNLKSTPSTRNPHNLARMRTITLSLTLLPLLACAQAGTLDPSFGNNGMVTTAFGDQSALAYGMTIQPDGKIIAVGAEKDTTSQDWTIAVARYDTDGALDASFGTGGKTLFSTDATMEWAHAVTVRPDGKILVAGESNFRPFIAQLTSDGALDASFSGDGKVVITSSPDCNVNGMVLQQDGKILLAGGFTVGVYFEACVWRVDDQGSLDPSFGGTGRVLTDLPGIAERYYAITAQNDGRIIAAGSISSSLYDNGFAVARYNTDGTLDLTFSGDGIFTHDAGGQSEAFYDVAVQPDGRVVAAGFSGAYASFTVLRFNADGSTDTSFDGDGAAHCSLGSSGTARAMALQPDGRILLAGIRNAGNTGQFAVARFTTNGAVDASFNSTGYVYTNIPGPNYGGELHDMVIDPSGRIVVLGIGSPSNANCDWVLCRYLNDADIGIHGPSALSVPRCFPDPVERGVPVQVTWKLADDEDRPDELLLTDMQGRVLMRAPRTVLLVGQWAFDTSTLPAGAYAIRWQVRTSPPPSSVLLVVQ